MPKPNDCENCPHFNKWLVICEDFDWVTKDNGWYCCKFEEGAVTGKEYLEELIDKNTSS